MEDSVRLVITGVLLLGFLAMFGQEAMTIWRQQKPQESEARTYIWTGISVLVGSVTAYYLAVDYPTLRDLKDLLPLVTASPLDDAKKWRGIYAIVYTLMGVIAVVTWSSRTQWTSNLMKNLATTFLGIAIPVVSKWLIPT